MRALFVGVLAGRDWVKAWILEPKPAKCTKKKGVNNNCYTHKKQFFNKRSL